MEAVADESPKDNTVITVKENNIGDSDKLLIPSAQELPKKSKREDRSKKDDKNVEQFLKSLNSVPTLEEKFSLVCKKYTQVADDNKKLQFYIKQTDKRYALLVKEREQRQLEFNKTVLVKSKLENLCRELQKQNKAIKEESILKIREEEEKRKETQLKFQTTLADITSLLHDNNEKNTQLRDDNISMTEKFKSLMQQHQLREQQVEKMSKQMELESELSDAKLQKASLEYQAEKERILAELEHTKVTLAQYRAKVMEMQANETGLQGQLAIYTARYDEFQNAMVKSNQVFGGFKEQIEKMSKKILKLEKESLSWKKRWETSQTALLDMCGERQTSDERVAATSRQLQHMQSLCRTLQAERNMLLNILKENNIERPPLPAPAPPSPVPSSPAPTPANTPASNARVDAMAANCAQLRQSLAHLQTQLNVLTINKGAKEDPQTPEKQKKSKSKKSKAEKQAQRDAAEKGDITKEAGTDAPSAADEIADETKPGATEDVVQNDIDNNKQEEQTFDSDKTMESLLIEAISVANVKRDGEKDDNDKEVVSAVLASINDEEIAEGTNSPEVISEENSKEDSSITEDATEDDGTNKSLLELSSNEEIAHLEEVKPILNED